MPNAPMGARICSTPATVSSLHLLINIIIFKKMRRRTFGLMQTNTNKINQKEKKKRRYLLLLLLFHG
jgi:hypothetical protein